MKKRHGDAPPRTDEQKRLMLRAATGRVAAPYRDDGTEKERRLKPRPVTLPSAESLRRLTED